MGELIKGPFKQHRSPQPARFHCPWVAAHHERCPSPLAWTYHVRFKVYETDKNFAVQFSTGIGSRGLAQPKSFSNSAPVYRKDLNRLWQYIFATLKHYQADLSAVQTALQRHAERTACPN